MIWMTSSRPKPCWSSGADGGSPWRAVVDLRAVVNIEDMDYAAGLVDPVDDSIGAPPGAATTGERPEQRLADPLRVHRKRRIAELQYGGGDGFRQPLGNRSPCGRLEPDLVPLRRFGRHTPVTRRRARSWSRLCPLRLHPSTSELS